MSKRTLIILAIALILGLPLLGALSGRQTHRFQQQEMSDSGSSSMGVAGTIEPAMMNDTYLAQNSLLYKDVGPNAPQVMPPPPTDGGFTTTTDRTIIRNAFLTLIVKDTRETVRKVTHLATQHAGFVTSSSVFEDEQSQGIVIASMILRVPAAKLDEVLENLRQLAETVQTESIAASDQTEQKVDLEAQIKNLKASETQLQSLMSKAQNVTQTLEIQRELSSIRGQIERLTAQVENLQGDANMATITLSISTEESELPLTGGERRGVLDEIRIAVKDAILLYRELFVAGLRFAILALPLLVLAGVGYGIWMWQKNRTIKRSN